MTGAGPPAAAPAPPVHAAKSGRLARRVRVAIAGVATYLTGVASPTMLEWWKVHAEDRNHADQLSDSERDYVLHVIELQSKATPAQAPAIAALTNVATKSYLRDQTFAGHFADAVTTYAVNISGIKAAQDVQTATSPPGHPESAGAAGALAQTQAAAAIVQASGASSAPATQAALQPARGRVFFQVGQQNDLVTANAVNSQLTALFRDSLTPIPGVQVIDQFTGPTQLRYFFQADRGQAQQLANALAGAFPGIVCRYVAGYEATGKTRPQLFEVWMKPGAHQTGAVRAAAAAVPC